MNEQLLLLISREGIIQQHDGIYLAPIPSEKKIQEDERYLREKVASVSYINYLEIIGKNHSIPFIDLVHFHIQYGKWINYPQKTSGKNFLDSDFHPVQFRLIYNTFSDRIVDYYLDGKLKLKTPKLINQFKSNSK